MPRFCANGFYPSGLTQARSCPLRDRESVSGADDHLVRYYTPLEKFSETEDRLVAQLGESVRRDEAKRSEHNMARSSDIANSTPKAQKCATGGPTPVHPIERRSGRRYPLGLRLQYEVPSTQQVGFGKIHDMSSHGIYFWCPDVLPKGSTVNLSIEWPIRLAEVTPLQLRVSGRVVRNDKRGTSIRTSRYEFRTRKIPPESTGAKLSTKSSVA